MDRGFLALGREATAIAQQGWLIARQRRRLAAAPSGDRVAVFIHGFMAAGPVFDPMRAAVSEATQLATLDFSYGFFEGFHGVAARFAEGLDALVPAESTISIVGHSLGGLLARWYIQELGGAARVDRLVSIATPHGGTLNARFAPAPIRDVLLPGSAVLRRLRPPVDAKGAPLPHTVIVAGADRLIHPIESASSIEGAKLFELGDVGHNEALFNPRVHRLVVDALR